MLALLHLQAVPGKSATTGYGIKVTALAHRPEDVPKFAGHFRTLLILQTTALGSRMGIPARKRQTGAAQSAGLVSVTLGACWDEWHNHRKPEADS